MNRQSTKLAGAHLRQQPVYRAPDAAQALLDVMARCGDAAFAVSGMAHWWLAQMKAVVARVQRMEWLDTMGQALAMHAYMIGVAMGLYGAQSAIVEGLRVNYGPMANAYRAPDGRAARRVFHILMAAGELEGRERLRQSGFDAPLPAGFECRTDMPARVFPVMSSTWH